MTTAVALALAAMCIAANAFFVAAEFAFAKARPSALQAQALRGDSAALRASKMSQNLDAYLSATQVGITLASLGLGWVGKPAVASFLIAPLSQLALSDTVVHGAAFAVAFGTISLLHIVVGELVPKTIAIRFPESVSAACASTLRMFFLLAWPVIWLLNGLSNFIVRSLPLPESKSGLGHHDFSEEELRLLVKSHAEQTDHGTRVPEIMERVLQAANRPARALMVPRVDMVTLPLDATVAECQRLAREHGFSRYPLCERGDPDRIVGYVHIKDLFTSRNPSRLSLQKLSRDVLFIPGSRNAVGLLSEFQHSRIPMAVVVDEYGGTDGIITLEDVVESLVGDIHDEHDTATARVKERKPQVYEVQGTTLFSDLELDGLDVGAEQCDESLGAYLTAVLGRIPRPGDRLDLGQWSLVVEDVRKRRLWRARLERTPHEPHPQSTSSWPSPPTSQEPLSPSKS